MIGSVFSLSSAIDLTPFSASHLLSGPRERDLFPRRVRTTHATRTQLRCFMPFGNSPRAVTRPA
jgi:hypothetical protein